MFPFKDIIIEDYVENFEICGEVRFNAAQLPDRNVMFWLGFVIFNGEKMTDREQFSGLCKPIVNIESGRTHWIDCCLINCAESLWAKYTSISLILYLLY